MNKDKTMKNQDKFHDGTTYKLFTLCQCGCGGLTRNRFLQGHDMKTPIQKWIGR